MASLDELTDALVKADAAGDVDSARTLTQHIDYMRGSSGDAQPTDAPTAAPAPQDNSQSPRFGSSIPGRFLQGAIVDPVIGGAQLIVNDVPKVADFFGAHDYADNVRGKAAQMNQGIRDYYAEYQGDRAANGSTGFDAPQFLGGLLSPANRVVPMGGAATAGKAAMLGMGQGAVSGALAPVTDGTDDDFARSKSLQVGTGTAVGGVAGAALNALAKGAGSLLTRFNGGDAQTAADTAIQKTAAEQGIDLTQMPATMVNDLRSRVADALKRGQNLDPKAAMRMAEGDAVLGPEAGLTVAQATRDPQNWAREFNLKSVEAGKPLAERFNAQNRALIDAVNKEGAGAAPGEFATGTQAIGALRATDNAEQSAIGGLYAQALAMHGEDIPLDAKAFTSQTSSELKKNMAEMFLPREFKTISDKIASGDLPLTLSTAEQLKTRVGMADAVAADGNTRFALGVFRKALDDAPILDEANTAEPVVNAFRTARTAAKARFDALDVDPARAAVLRDAQPDAFFQKYVVNGTVRDLQNMKTGLDPDATESTRAQIAGYLKQKALGSGSDETGSFSQAGYNRALRDLGDDKLSVFFSPQQVAQLHRIGRIATYVDVAPAKGALPNRSGTAAAAIDMATSAIPIFNLNAPKEAIKKFASDRAVKNALAGEVPLTYGPGNALSRNYLQSLSGGIADYESEDVPRFTRTR